MSDNHAVDGLRQVQESIRRAASDYGRDPSGITLVAVSKTFPAEAIEPVLAVGQRVFGENYVQEAKTKWPGLRARFPDVELHMIGPLQSNKAREAVELFDVIHTLDRPSLAEALAKEIARQGRTPRLLVQVNTGEEPQKGGVIPTEVHPAGRGPAVASFRPAQHHREAPWPRRAIHGHECRFRCGDPARRDPCTGRQRDLRSKAVEGLSLHRSEGSVSAFARPGNGR